MGLAENASERADRDLVLLGNDRRIDDIAGMPDELDMAPFLACFDETAASSRRLISLKGSGLSRANLDLDRPDLRHSRSVRGLEVEFPRFLQIGQRLLFALTLAGNVEFQALRDVPIAFPPNGRSKGSLHDFYSFTRARWPQRQPERISGVSPYRSSATTASPRLWTVDAPSGS